MWAVRVAILTSRRLPWHALVPACQEYEQGMRRLLNYALALEAEVRRQVPGRAADSAPLELAISRGPLRLG